MQPGKYIRLGLQHIWKKQWWVLLIALAVMSLGLVATDFTWWFVGLGLIGYGLYWAFWWIQMFGVTKLEQTKMFFDPMIYVIDNQHLLMEKPGRRQRGQREAMPVQWPMFKSAEKRKDAFVFYMSKGQFIYLPFEAFKSQAEIKFTEAVLKRKQLI